MMGSFVLQKPAGGSTVRGGDTLRGVAVVPQPGEQVAAEQISQMPLISPIEVVAYLKRMPLMPCNKKLDGSPLWA